MNLCEFLIHSDFDDFVVMDNATKTKVTENFESYSLVSYDTTEDDAGNIILVAIADKRA